MEFSEILSRLDRIMYEGASSESSMDAQYSTLTDIPAHVETVDNVIPLNERDLLADIPPFMPKIPIDLMNIQPAVATYGHPPIPPPYPRPVKWLLSSRPENVINSAVDPTSSSDSFGQDDLTTIQGIQRTSQHSQHLHQMQCHLLEQQFNQLNEKHQQEKMIYEKLLRSVENAKCKNMSTFGDLVRENEMLDERCKELRQKLLEIDGTSLANIADVKRKNREKISSLLKVIKEKEDEISHLSNEITTLRNFGEDKERVQASVEALKMAAKNRHEQQQLELESIHLLEEAEQKKLQGMAADRLITLTAENYDKALENAGVDVMAIFYKHVEVQNAINVWLERDKELKKEKAQLEAKLFHVFNRRQTGIDYLRRAGLQLDKLYQDIHLLEKRCETAQNDYKRNMEKYELNCYQIVPLVQKHLRQRTNRLRELERSKTVRRAEVKRMKQLSHIVQPGRSSMETAFIWAIKNVMEQIAGSPQKDVQELSWIEREMVLRRVFVYMNMENQKNNETQADLTDRVEKYVTVLEANLDKLSSTPSVINKTIMEITRPGLPVDESMRQPEMVIKNQTRPVLPTPTNVLPKFGFQK